MIEPAPHTDAEQSWEAISKWIADKVKMPDGRPLDEAIVKVIAVGACIGARFSLLMPPFALGLSEYSNEQTGPLWASIQHGFIEDYAELLNLPRSCDVEREAQIHARRSPDSADSHFIYVVCTHRTSGNGASSTPEQHPTTNGLFDEVQR